MTKHEVKQFMDKVVKAERLSMQQVLVGINLAEDCKLHLELGYSSLFAWLVGEYKYSESAAGRRISAARLLRNVPEVAKKIETGEVNLSTLAKTQSAIRVYERVTGDKISQEDQAIVVEKIQNKSITQTEQALLEMMPETANLMPKERITVISPTEYRLSLNLNTEAMDDFEWVKAFLSHSIPVGEASKIFARLLREFRERNENKTTKRITAAAEKQRVEKKEGQTGSPRSKEANVRAAISGLSITSERSVHSGLPATPELSAAPVLSAGKNNYRQCDREELQLSQKQKDDLSDAAMKQLALERANYKCQFKNPVTGKLCGSTYQVQADHIMPMALGGPDHINNYRCLCATHNRFMAEKLLGKQRANVWRGTVRETVQPYL